MKKLGQYINRLLHENDTVIIPGFGALVSKYKPAEINSETGEITPPSKDFSFNRQVQNDDGLLVDFIAESESLPQSNALKFIEKECESIIYRLDKGEKVLLEEVGEFFLNENNEIQFEPHFKENMLLDSFGLEPVNIFEENTDEEPIKKSVSKTKKKSGKLWYLMLIILLAVVIFLVLIASVVLIMLGDKAREQKNHQNIELQEEIADETCNLDSMQTFAPDSIIDSMQNSVEIIEYEDIIEPDLIESAKFYLVGGSFKEKKNAEKYIEQPGIEGYEPFYIDKVGNFHLVGIGRYDTKEEAYIAKKDYTKKRPYLGVWVYEKE